MTESCVDSSGRVRENAPRFDSVIEIEQLSVATGDELISIPALNTNGDLPQGIHAATLDEVFATFGNANSGRGALFQRLERIHGIAARTGHLARFVVFGSFVTDKPVPNDVDVFMVFDDSFDASVCDSEVLLMLDHATADSHFGASVFWLRRPAAIVGNRLQSSSGKPSAMVADVASWRSWETSDDPK
jgi:hypothetical protein